MTQNESGVITFSVLLLSGILIPLSPGSPHQLAGTSSGWFKKKKKRQIDRITGYKSNKNSQKKPCLLHLICCGKSFTTSTWFGLIDTRRGWDPLLFHPVGLRAQDETKEILVWNRWSLCCGTRSGAPLVVQSGTLEHSAGNAAALANKLQWRLKSLIYKQ